MIKSTTQASRGDLPSEFTMRLADFSSLTEALEYAALTGEGLNFFNSRGHCENSVTYANIVSRAQNLACRLLNMGLIRGDSVGIVADTHPDFVTMFFACQYAGLLAIPLPAITGPGARQGYEMQLHNILKTSEARLVTGPDSFAPYLKAAAENTSVETITSAATLMEKPVGEPGLQPLQPDEISHIQYSSGSTHYPKGIEITQAAVMANARAIAADALKFTRSDRVASWLPFYHDMGLVGCLLVPVTCQLTTDYLPTDGFARRPLQWLKMIAANHCTISFSPTFGYEICSRRALRSDSLDIDLSNWRVAGIGGDMIQDDVFREFARVFEPYGFKPECLVPSYGLAEATLAFSFAPLGTGVRTDLIDKDVLRDEHFAKSVVNGSVEATNSRAFVSCGKPMPGYNVDIRDEDGRSLTERHVGCVFLKGPSLMRAYYKNDRETSLRFDEGGWLNTGDMGYVVNGELYITGRQKDLIIINGRNIWPQDLEWTVESSVDALRSRDTVAFSVEDPQGREIPVVMVHCRSRNNEDRKALRQQVHDVLIRNTGLDCKVELVPPGTLPFTSSGKLSRAAAKKGYLNGEYQLDVRADGADE